MMALAWGGLGLMQQWLPIHEEGGRCLRGEDCRSSAVFISREILAAGAGRSKKRKHSKDGSDAGSWWGLRHDHGMKVEDVNGRALPTQPDALQANPTRVGPLPCRDEFSFTRLISEHAKHGHGRQALSTYREMREQGVIPTTYTLVAALKACSSVADLDTGREVHGHAIRSGVELDIFVANALVDMYGKCKSMADARHVFGRMPHPTVVSWTALIMGYVQCREADLALRLFVHMWHEGITPAAHTFVAVLKACGILAVEEEGRQVGREIVKVNCLAEGRAIHSEITKVGLESDTYVATAVLCMYVKCGSVKDAQQVFQRMQHRTVVSWNSMIIAYAQIDKGELALQLYACMQQEGFAPDGHTFVAVLKACSSLALQEEGKQANGSLLKVRSLETGRSIHSQVVKGGFEKDIFVATSLLDMYVKCGSVKDACLIFQAMEYHDLVSWTTLIMGCAKMDEGELALRLFSLMQGEGFTPDSCTYVAALMACSSLAAQEEGTHVNGEFVKAECLEKGKAIHSQVRKSGFEADMHVANTLLDMYVKCGSMTHAHKVFGKMRHRDIVSWTALIMGYAQAEKGEVALQLYACMKDAGITPDTITFVAVLKACGTLASLETGKKIHAEIRMGGLEDDATVASSLVDMYGKCGSMVDAQEVFDAMPVRNIVRWSALIAGYSGHGNSDQVFTLFEKMQQEGIQPDAMTFTSVLAACSHGGLVDKGRRYFESMYSHHGIIPGGEHYNCMFDLLGRSGRLDEVMAMLKRMPFKPVIVTWTVILAVCRKWKNLELGTHAFGCAVILDQRKAAAYVLMKNIYTSSYMWKENAAIQLLRSRVPTSEQLEECWWCDNTENMNMSPLGDSCHFRGKDINPQLEYLFAKNEEQGHVFDLDSIFQNIFDDEKHGNFYGQSEKLSALLFPSNLLPG